MSAAAITILRNCANGWFWFSQKVLMLAASKFNKALPLVVFTFSSEMTSRLLSIGSKSHRRVQFGSWLGCDFSITVHPILKSGKFSFLETVIQGFHFLLCNLLDIFAPCSRKVGGQVDLPSSTQYVDDWLRFSRYTSMQYTNGWCRIIVAVNSPLWADALPCMNIFWTSDSKYCRQQSLWDEWCCISHCPINWWAFLFNFLLILLLAA